MARDSSPYVESALLTITQAGERLVALVPAERHYPAQRPPNPRWPFIGVGVPIVTPLRMSGADGCSVSLAMHAFAETSGVGEATISGKDAAQAIVSEIVALLGGEEGCEIILADAPFPAQATAVWTGSQCVQDGGDANAFHAWATFDITIIS